MLYYWTGGGGDGSYDCGGGDGSDDCGGGDGGDICGSGGVGRREWRSEWKEGRRRRKGKYKILYNYIYLGR